MGLKKRSRNDSSDENNLPEVTYEQKRDLSERMNDLATDKLQKVFQIIHEGMPQLKEAVGQEEIELDIDILDKRTLHRLYKFVKQNTKGSGSSVPQSSSKTTKKSKPALPETSKHSKEKKKRDDSSSGSSSSGSSSSGSDSDSGSNSD